MTTRTKLLVLSVFGLSFGLFSAILANGAHADDLVKEWASTHDKHECADASTVYVCRAGKNLSVRCE